MSTGSLVSTTSGFNVVLVGDGPGRGYFRFVRVHGKELGSGAPWRAWGRRLIVSLVFNPVASAVGWVARWIIEHIPPLPERMLETDR